MVNVLISTYNGEKYIREQLDSILRQSCKDIKIYVRDDGSSDRTVSILKEYENQNRITLIQGENVGYGRSFYKLLQIADQGDYWSFCDQDDVWLPDKVKWAVEWLGRQPETVPALFGNAYELTDETLKTTYGVQRSPRYRLDFRRALTDCVYQGFAMTFNARLRELMLMASENEITSHDWWGMLLAIRFGIHYFDDRIAVKHRRLKSSISGMDMKNRVKWLRNTLKDGHPGIHSCAKEYIRLFGGCSDKESRYAQWFTFEKYNLKASLCKSFYPGRWRPLLSSEIVIRILMLIGRV